MEGISRLGDTVVRQLRSSSVLADLSHIVDELVCNSLDADSTEVCIHLDVKACYVRVEDNGRGISRNDFDLLGERHATSKLRSMTDLEAGTPTLGFRGEALSSISDLGLLEITSRMKGSPHTYRKILKSSKTLTLGLSGEQRDTGTTVVVKDAFYNQPVRRKYFLESSHKVFQLVLDRILRLALIHPKVEFVATSMERQQEVFRAKPASSLSSRIRDMFGKEARDSLEKIDFAKGKFRLSGYISKHVYTFSGKVFQYLYINRRYVQRSPLHKLLSSWHKTIRGSDSSLSFVLHLGCPLGEYDITLDAHKTLVEFKDWKYVLSFVEEVIGSIWCLEGASKCKTLLPRKRKLSEGFEQNTSGQHNSGHEEGRKTVPEKDQVADTGPDKWRRAVSDMLDEARSNVLLGVERPVLEIGHGPLSASSGVLVPEHISKDTFLQARVLKQVDTKFIAAVTKGTLIFVDQHAADERIRLEELRSKVLASSEGHGVALQNPEEINLNPVDQELLIAYLAKVNFWGWSVHITKRDMEVGNSLLTTVPMIMGVRLTSTDLLEYLRQLGETHGSSAPPPAVLKILNFKACRGAIMFGDILLPSECQQLVNALKRTDLCFQCAHGRPTMVPIVDLKALRKRSRSLETTSLNIGDTTASITATAPQRKRALRREAPTLQRAAARLQQATNCNMATGLERPAT